MENKEILQNKKLVAEFAGFNYYPRTKCPSTNMIIREHWSISTINHSFPDNTIFRNNFKFHKSWDWLMPVVEKIEGLGFEVLIGRISCNINKVLDRENPIVSFVCGDISKKREIVYSAIVEFINWYNKNK